MATTTGSVVNYYYVPRNWTFNNKKKNKKMHKPINSEFALDLLNSGFSARESIELVTETDFSKAAKKMAARIKDPEKRKAAEKKFKDNIEKFASMKGKKKK